MAKPSTAWQERCLRPLTTHKLWTIPELVEEIISYLPGSALPALMMTSRVLLDHLVPRVWETVDLYVLLTLTYAIWTSGDYCKDMDAKLRRYMLYEQHIRSVGLGDSWFIFKYYGRPRGPDHLPRLALGLEETQEMCSDDEPKQLSFLLEQGLKKLLSYRVDHLTLTAPSVLPHLTCLTLKDHSLQYCKPHNFVEFFQAPTLESLTLDFESHSDLDRYASLDVLLDDLPVKCPQFRELNAYLHVDKHTRKEDIGVVRALVPVLKHLRLYASNVWSYHPDILHDLSQLPHLEDLSLNNDVGRGGSTRADAKILDALVPKPNRRQLLKRYTCIQEARWFPSLVCLQLKGPLRVIQRVIPLPSQLPRSGTFLPKLKEVAITVRKDPSRELEDRSDIATLLDTLARCTSITHLSIDVVGCLKLTDSDILTCARAWPNLRKLEFVRDDGYPTITSQSLVHLARHCRHIDGICLPLLTAEPVNIPHDLIPSTQDLELELDSKSLPGNDWSTFIRSMWPRVVKVY